MKARKKAFRGENLKKIKDEHIKAFTLDQGPHELGYPDTGSGRISDTLPYKDWFEMNQG